MIHYQAPGGARSHLWSISMTEGRYALAAVIAWTEVHKILSKKWDAGSFVAGLLLYLYTKDGE